MLFKLILDFSSIAINCFCCVVIKSLFKSKIAHESTNRINSPNYHKKAVPFYSQVKDKPKYQVYTKIYEKNP